MAYLLQTYSVSLLFPTSKVFATAKRSSKYFCEEQKRFYYFLLRKNSKCSCSDSFLLSFLLSFVLQYKTRARSIFRTRFWPLAKIFAPIYATGTCASQERLSCQGLGTPSTQRPDRSVRIVYPPVQAKWGLTTIRSHIE